jgi:hypothetical protein
MGKNVLEIVKQTGIDIVQDGDIVFWQGEYGGQTKPQGPLAGKKVACLVGSEFSDFQAYYLASYIGEFGGEYNENWAAVVDGSQVSGRTPPEIPEYVDAIMVALLCGELNIED